jgi:hypothetical protein
MQAFVVFIVICLGIGFIKFCVQGSKQYFCVGCERLVRGVHSKRPTWSFLLGPLMLVFTPKLTCRWCKSHDVIPANSPKARRIARGGI